MSEWQPIETAPKDGTPVLLFKNGWIGVGLWHEGTQSWWILGDAVVGATHWMPLPAPPSAP